MGFFSNFLGGGVKEAGQGIQSAGEGVKTALDSGGGFLKSIRTALTGVDPDSKARIEEALSALEGEMYKGRQEIEKIITMAGAQHKNPFVAVFLAGWRPFIGWVCGLSLALYFIPQYVLGSIIWARAAWLAAPYMKQAVIINGVVTQAAELVIPQIPAYPISAEGLMELTLGMLGLVIMRSVDKKNKVNNVH